MTTSRIRGGVAAALVLTTTALATAAISPTAFASLPGTSDSVLTSYDGTAIHFADGSSIPAAGQANDVAAWAPDGSRAAFIGTDSSILSVRHDGGAAAQSIKLLDGASGVTRSHPSWTEYGSELVFAEQPGSGKPWAISASQSSNTSIFFTGEKSITTDAANDYTWPDEGPNGFLVFQQQADDGHGNPTGTPNVVTLDSNGQVKVVDLNASEPSISPLGDRVAFVQNGQIWTSDMSGGNLTQITADADTHDAPTWSPDGATIAFRTQDAGGNTVGTAAADGSQKAAPVAVQGLAYGMPAYQTRNTPPDSVTVLAGTNRFGTAVAISKALWADAGQANGLAAQSVTLSRSDTFADAVSGSALAAAKQGPLLMTPPNSFNTDTQHEIQRVLPKGKTVYILGSTMAISASTENAIKALGYNTVRFAGTDRYDTSIKIANAISPTPGLAFVATGLNFPDALGAGAAAGSFDVDAGLGLPAVVLLTRDGSMPAETESYLETHSMGLVSVGAQADTALQSQHWSGYFVDKGTNRYETARKVAEDWFVQEPIAGVATGRNWPDALAGGAFLAMVNGPLLLTDPAKTTLDVNASDVLSEKSGQLGLAFIFGATLPAQTASEIGAAMSGPGGFVVDSPASALAAAKQSTPLSRAAKALGLAGLVLRAHAAIATRR